jgi:hypothetical protein
MKERMKINREKGIEGINTNYSIWSLEVKD